MLSDLGHIQDPTLFRRLEGKTNIRAKCQRHISRSDPDWKPQQEHGGQSCRQSLILVIDKQESHQCKSTTTAKHPTTTRATPADCAHRKSKWWTRGSEQRHERRVKETGLGRAAFIQRSYAFWDQEADSRDTWMMKPIRNKHLNVSWNHEAPVWFQQTQAKRN